MERTEIIKQIVQFNKTLFEAGFRTLTFMQDQAEKTYESFWEENRFLPKEGKNFVDEWAKVYKAGCESFKNHADAAFSKVEAFFEAKSN